MKTLFWMLFCIILSVTGFIVYQEKQPWKYQTSIHINTYESTEANRQTSAAPDIVKKTDSIAIIFIPCDNMDLNMRAMSIMKPATVIIDTKMANAAELYSFAINNNIDVVVKINMEPANFPENNPGPNTLLTGITETENISKLKKLLENYNKCVGVINFGGDRFISSAKDMIPILSYLNNEKLTFIDSNSANIRTLTQFENYTGAKIETCDIFMENEMSEKEIEDGLLSLESNAINRGLAVGILRCSENTVKSLELWIKKIKAEGKITLSGLRDS